MATGKIYVDGEIVPDSWIWDDETATSLVRVRNQVLAAGEVDDYEVYIFSPGGFCSEGWAIYDYLLTLNKPIKTYAYGQCASIATVIFLAGSERFITPNCDFMVHLPWGDAWGNMHDIQAYLNELIVESNKITSLYATATGKPESDIAAMLTSDYHMTGAQAVEQGFATVVLQQQVQAIAARKTRQLQTPVARLRKPEDRYEKPKNTAVSRNTNMSKKASTLDTLFAQMKSVILGTPAKAMDINVTSGQVLVIDATNDTPAVGDACTIDGNPAPDGNYTASDDSTVYTVAGGNLSAIVVPDPNNENADAAALAAKDTEIADLKQKLEAATAAQAKAKTERDAHDTAVKAKMDAFEKALGESRSKDIQIDGNDGDGVDPKDKNEKPKSSATDRARARKAEAAKNRK